MSFHEIFLYNDINLLIKQTKGKLYYNKKTQIIVETGVEKSKISNNNILRGNRPIYTEIQYLRL